jgi:hypothetical protein
MIPASPSRWAATMARVVSSSLKGATSTSATALDGSPAEVGSPRGKSSSRLGKRLTVPISLAPWYAPSNFSRRGRPVNARASRTA